MRAGSRVRAFGVAVACAGGLLGATAGAAQATIVFSSSPNLLTDPATVGQTNLPGSIVISDDSSPPDESGASEIDEIRFTPACGTFTDPPCTSPEPGVISINPVATGALGTACAGRTFNFPVTDNLTGEVATDIPIDNPLVLGDGNECRINFTYNVLKSPAVDSQPGEDGVQTDAILRVRYFHPGDFGIPESLGSDFTTINPAPATTPPPAAGPTGQRAAALKKCAKVKKKKAKKKCKRKANLLPI